MKTNAQLRNEDSEDLQCVKNLLILQLIRDGATSEEISLALRAGKVSPSNIRMAFPIRKIKKKTNQV